jgi:hypothetical protein
MTRGGKLENISAGSVRWNPHGLQLKMGRISSLKKEPATQTLYRGFGRERRAWNPHRPRRIYVEIQTISLRFAQSARRVKPVRTFDVPRREGPSMVYLIMGQRSFFAAPFFDSGKLISSADALRASSWLSPGQKALFWRGRTLCPSQVIHARTCSGVCPQFLV